MEWTERIIWISIVVLLLVLLGQATRTSWTRYKLLRRVCREAGLEIPKEEDE